MKNANLIIKELGELLSIATKVKETRYSTEWSEAVYNTQVRLTKIIEKLEKSKLEALDTETLIFQLITDNPHVYNEIARQSDFGTMDDDPDADDIQCLIEAFSSDSDKENLLDVIIEEIAHEKADKYIDILYRDESESK